VETDVICSTKARDPRVSKFFLLSLNLYLSPFHFRTEKEKNNDKDERLFRSARLKARCPSTAHSRRWR
jgi:hypothetical protein